MAEFTVADALVRAESPWTHNDEQLLQAHALLSLRPLAPENEVLVDRIEDELTRRGIDLSTLGERT